MNFMYMASKIELSLKISNFQRASVREDVLNIVVFALLTFPSYEFDLKNIAATIVPTLVDPKRRVRQASQECVAILAAFMGPTKAAPLIRSIELLESHFEHGTGVLNAVQVRFMKFILLVASMHSPTKLKDLTTFNVL